jgi:hypothetical protein
MVPHQRNCNCSTVRVLGNRLVGSAHEDGQDAMQLAFAADRNSALGADESEAEYGSAFGFATGTLNGLCLHFFERCCHFQRRLLDCASASSQN